MPGSQGDLRDSVRVVIEGRCGGDESQLLAILTRSRRVFVEAPAGYGKTTAMTGRACWLLASGEVPPPKRVMALTFSVAAARRMRADMSAALSAFFFSSFSDFSMSIFPFCLFYIFSAKRNSVHNAVFAAWRRSPLRSSSKFNSNISLRSRSATPI